MMICPGYNIYVNKNQMKMYCYEGVPPYLWNICDYCVKIGCADKFGDKIKEFDACGKPGETVCDHMEFSCNCFNCHEVMNKQFCGKCLASSRNAIGHINCENCGTNTNGSKYCYPCSYLLKVCPCGEPHIFADMEQSELDEISRYFELEYMRHCLSIVDVNARRKSFYISEKAAMTYPEGIIIPSDVETIFIDPAFTKIRDLILSHCEETADEYSYKGDHKCVDCGTYNCPYLTNEGRVSNPKTSYGLHVSLPNPESIAKIVAKMIKTNSMYIRIFALFTAKEILESESVIMEILDNDDVLMRFPTSIFINNYDNLIYRKYMQRLIDLNNPCTYYYGITRVLYDSNGSIMAHRHKQKFLPVSSPEFAVRVAAVGVIDRVDSMAAKVCAILGIHDTSVVLNNLIDSAIETGNESKASNILISRTVKPSVEILYKCIEFKRSIIYAIIRRELQLTHTDHVHLFNSAVDRTNGDEEGDHHLQLIAEDNMRPIVKSYMTGDTSPQVKADFKYMADKYKETFGKCSNMITELMFEKMISEEIAEDLIEIGYVPTEKLLERLCKIFIIGWNEQKVDWWVVAMLRVFRKYFVIASQNEHVPYVYKDWSDEFNARLLEFERTHDYKRAPTQSSLISGGSNMCIASPVPLHCTTWVNVFYDEEYFFIIDKLKSFTSYPAPDMDETAKNKYDCTMQI